MSEPEILKDLLLQFRTLSENSHSILDEILKLLVSKCYQVSYVNENNDVRTFFLNRHSRAMLRDFLLNTDEIDSGTADYMKEYCFSRVFNLEVKEFVRSRSTEGSYFPYVNRSEIDLSRYQIYQESQEREEEHCLLFALDSLGVDISLVYNFVINSYIKMSSLKQIAMKLGININLHLFGKNEKQHVNKYPKKDRFPTTVDIALYKDHYFIFDKVGKENSLNLVHRLFLENQFEPLPSIETTLSEKEVPLEKLIVEQKCFSVPAKKSLKDCSISYADTECITKPFHKAFLYARYYTYNGEENYKVFSETGNYSGFKSFLNSFSHKHNIIYFHNLKYDWFVIKNCPFIKIISVVSKDANYYKVSFLYGKKKFDLRDSLKLIPKKLADFPRTFNLENMKKQEFILYDLYTEQNSFDEVVDYVMFEEYTNQSFEIAYTIENDKYKKIEKVFEESILIDKRIVVPKRIFNYCGSYFVGNRYYHISHCRNYLRYDCLILKKGIERYRQYMLDLIDIDCFTELTLPSMVHKRVCLNNFYEGVYELEDNLRVFVSQSVHGGRVCSKDNMMWKCQGIIKPIDAKSMFPSSIRRICKEGGFPIGPAKVFKEFDSSVYYYIVKIKILSVNRYQQLPFISIRDKQGYRHYLNKLEDTEMVIDKITLEDWIQFQEIKYEFIEGIYWDQGGNSSIQGFIEKIYSSRQKCTEDGNTSMSEICKLVLNSLYGKTIAKPIKKKHIIKENSKVPEYIDKNYERLISMEECGNQSIITVVNNEMGHFNMSHLGGMILSMARRMINEIINLSTELGIHILYHDTDSLHIVDTLFLGNCYNNKLLELEKEYRERYNRELIGKELEQFDYDLKYPGHTDIYSSQCIVLGKKAYIHRITGLNDNEEREYFDCPKIAGVNTYAMNEYPDKWNLYERLYSGEEVVFDLCYGDGVMFQFRETVTTRESFKKVIKYENEKRELN